jgi:hypothetical protein
MTITGYTPGSVGEGLVGRGSSRADVPAGTAGFAIKNAPGRLCTVVLLAANGANPITFYDNTAGSGAVLFVVPASTTQTVFIVDTPANIGIFAVGGAGTAACAVSFS